MSRSSEHGSPTWNKKTDHLIKAPHFILISWDLNGLSASICTSSLPGNLLSAIRYKAFIVVISGIHPSVCSNVSLGRLSHSSRRRQEWTSGSGTTPGPWNPTIHLTGSWGSTWGVRSGGFKYTILRIRNHRVADSSRGIRDNALAQEEKSSCMLSSTGTTSGSPFAGGSER